MPPGNAMLKIVKYFYFHFLYKMYVRNNDLIIRDILHTIEIHKCTPRKNELFWKFYHLMWYYPSFVGVFQFRTGEAGTLFKSLTVYSPYSFKIFKCTKIKGGLMSWALKIFTTVSLINVVRKPWAKLVSHYNYRLKTNESINGYK
jgi:hypothetical protein